jgi:hypothetical protein
VTDAQVAGAGALASRLLSGPITFTHNAAHHYDLPPTALAQALRVVPDPAGPGSVALQFDRATLAELVGQVATQLESPAANPGLELRGDTVVIRPGKPGQLVDREAALRETLARLDNGDRQVTLPMKDDRPAIADSGLDAARDWVNDRLARPLTLEYQDRRWELTRADLAPLLALPDVDAVVRASDPSARTLPLDVHLDVMKLRDLLVRSLLPRIGMDPARTVADAALELHDHRVEIRAARSGLGVDYDALVGDLSARFASLDPAARTVQVQVAERAPRVADEDLAAARDLANTIIGREIVVRDAFDEWKISPAELESMLKLRNDAGLPMAYLGRDKLLERTEQIARLAEARTGATQVRAANGRPATVDRLLTAATIWAAAQSDDRTLDLQWAG